jgi:hypothetical protein
MTGTPTVNINTNFCLLARFIAQDLEECGLRNVDITCSKTLQLCLSSLLLFEMFHL